MSTNERGKLIGDIISNMRMMAENAHKQFSDGDTFLALAFKSDKELMKIARLSGTVKSKNPVKNKGTSRYKLIHCNACERKYGHKVAIAKIYKIDFGGSVPQDHILAIIRGHYKLYHPRLFKQMTRKSVATRLMSNPFIEEIGASTVAGVGLGLGLGAANLITDKLKKKK
jgi:hypothetical protein